MAKDQYTLGQVTMRTGGMRGGRAVEKNYGSQLPSNVDIGDEVVLYTREGPCVSVVVYK